MLNKRITSKFIISVIALILLVLTILSGRGISPAFADTSNYTSALTDLQKDGTFKASDFPDNATDYSIKVIQIAESVNGELFVYTYQPAQKTRYLVATDINMSLSESADGTKLYGLTLLNNDGVFFKYKVNGLTVSSSAIRYYNITSIYRNWINGIDKETGNDNVQNAVAHEVGQLWKLSTNSNGITYEMLKTETLEITSKYVGSYRYPNGTSWFTSSACDSHFIAFTTDHRIDKLLEADITYLTNSYETTLTGTKYGNLYSQRKKTLKYDMVAGNTVNGLFGKSYQWKRIQSVSEFLNGKDIDDSVKKELSKNQWILNFAETEYTKGGQGITSLISWIGAIVGSQYSSGTLVSEVSILRLKFEADGKTYNLGVVDGKQTGTNSPINSTEILDFFSYVWNCIVKLITGQASTGETVIAVIALIIALVVVVCVIKFIKWVVKGIFK